jgi:hypothetical protein
MYAIIEISIVIVELGESRRLVF